MARAEERTEESVKRAELFEILAHQTRIRILRVLENQTLSFGELKRILGMESSGHLQYHLGKLGDLIEQTEDGKYATTDDAKEALRLLDVMEKARGQAPIVAMPEGSRKTKLYLLSLIAVSTVFLLFGLYEYCLLVRSIPLFDPIDLSKQVLDLMGQKYDYLMLTTADLQNGTRIAYHGAIFTYLDRTDYLYLTMSNATTEGGRLATTFELGGELLDLDNPPENITAIIWSLARLKCFRVEFEDGQVIIIQILPWAYSSFVPYIFGVTVTRLPVTESQGYAIVPLYNGATIRVITLASNVFPWEVASRAYAFQIGPNSVMLLVRHDK